METDTNNNDNIKYAWHYTSPQGLYGILTDSCFHVTNAKFLNDPSEIKYADNVLIKAMVKYHEHPKY